MSGGLVILLVIIVTGIGTAILYYLHPHCKHSWEIKDHVIIPSKLEVMNKNGFAPERVSSNILEEKHIVSYYCKGCGKLKIVKETNK